MRRYELVLRIYRDVLDLMQEFGKFLGDEIGLDEFLGFYDQQTTIIRDWIIIYWDEVRRIGEVEEDG